MRTITKEQAQKIIEAADEVITALAGTNEDVHPESDNMLHLWDDLNDRYAPPEVVRELARIALASLEAEPVAEVCEGFTLRYIGHGPAPKSGVRIRDRLYAAPPAPVSVPDEATPDNIQMLASTFAPRGVTYQWERDECNAAADSWNACRAAMLQGAEPVSNRDELPLDYLQGQKDGLEWAAQLAEANHPQTGDWLYDDPVELAKAIRKGPDMPESRCGNSPVIPDGWVLVPIEPTYQMCEAMGLPWESPRFPDRYRAMIASAPQQEV